jgi:hypothetical protein
LTTDELIQTQTSKIGLIAAEIAKTLVSSELATRENITVLGQRLETWRSEVPSMLQVSTLTSGNSTSMSVYQRRAILMLHVCLYLNVLSSVTDLSSGYVSRRHDLDVSTITGRDSCIPIDQWHFLDVQYPRSRSATVPRSMCPGRAADCAHLKLGMGRGTTNEALLVDHVSNLVILVCTPDV